MARHRRARKNRRCPTPRKVAHPTAIAAMAAAQRAGEWYDEAMYHYRCPCGAWHTSRTNRTQPERQERT